MRRIASVLLISVAAWAHVAIADPVVSQGLFIRPGESVAFTIENGQPDHVRTLGVNDKPTDAEIEAHFSADGSTLKITNHTKTLLNYQAFVARGLYDKGKRTSVCTLMTDVSSFENWPGGLPGLRLNNFTSASGGIVCK